MSEPFIIDHNNPKKVEVFVGDILNPFSWAKRYPIAFIENSCLFINEIYETKYEKTKEILPSFLCITHSWRPIKEPKFRAFRDDEFNEAVKLLWGKCIRYEYEDKIVFAEVDYIDMEEKLINYKNLDYLFKYWKYSDSPFSTEWKVIGKECEEWA